MAVNRSPEQWSPSAPASEIAPGFWRLPMPIAGHSLAVTSVAFSSNGSTSSRKQRRASIMSKIAALSEAYSL